MKFTKIKLILLFIISLVFSKKPYSQTFIIPHIGFSIHNLKINEVPVTNNYYFDNLDNKFDFSIGLDIQYYLWSRWFLNLHSSYYFLNHEYTFHSFGINPCSQYVYQIANLGFAIGLEILPRLELGIGIKNVTMYNMREKQYVLPEKKLLKSSLNLYLSYYIKKLEFKFSYSNSIHKKELMGINIAELSVGYRFKIFNPIQKRKRVYCPKI